MARLKSRTKFPPRGFQLLLPEVNMTKPLSGSFNQMVDAFARIVKANPAMAEKNNWPTDRVAQEDWVDEREAKRMLANGWFGFVEEHGGFSRMGGEFPQYRKGVGVAGAKTALSIYREMFGPDGKTVPREQAEARATTCVACPLNDTATSLRSYFVEAMSGSIMALYGMLHDLETTTSLDEKLGVCTACLCPNKAKVHVPLGYIEQHMKSEVWTRLHPTCWMLRERGGSA